MVKKVISQRMLPPVAIVISFLIIYRVVGLTDSRIGMIIVYIGLQLSFLPS